MASKFSDVSAGFQSTLLAALVLLLAGAVFWYLVRPLSAKVSGIKKEVESLRAQNISNKVFEAQRADYLQRIAQSEKQLEVSRSTVPDGPTVNDFVKMVHDAEVSTAVHLRTFVAQPLVAQDLYTEMPFKVRLDGTYYALLNFFSRLVQGQRIVSVTSLSLGAPSGGGLGKYTVEPGETVGANCVLTTYFNQSQPQGKAVGSKQ